MSSLTQNPDLRYWLAFNQITAIGPTRLQKIIAAFPNLECAWQASVSELVSANIELKSAETFASERQKINPETELEKVSAKGCQVLILTDESYPAALKEMYAPPPLLYCLGNADALNQKAIAIVGSRKMSAYGQRVTELFATELARSGLGIVSGLAYGVDACAHARALANNGITVAVLGCGLNTIYPSSHRGLAEKIVASGGALISEFPLDMPPLKHHFPQRNRIIAGLSLATVVTEASAKSGTLITASFALEAGREVFAVPGNIFAEQCFGTNQLIATGARMALSPTDVLDVLQIESQPKEKMTTELTEMEKIILEFLNDREWHVDKLAQFARLDISIVNATLVQLELKGLVKHLGNQCYCKM